jgi:hypothetical protein
MTRLTEDQLIEIINEAMERHISRDPSVVNEDQKWENQNFVRTLSHRLRAYGFDLPPISKDPYADFRDPHGQIVGM